MATGKFIDENRPNKQVVMNEMYHFASKYVHHVNTTILPAHYPFRPLRRLFRYGMVGTNDTINCYELEKKIYLSWMKASGKQSILGAIKRLKKAGYPIVANKLKAYNDNILHAPVTPFMDLDFCGTWLGKNSIKEGLKNQKSPFAIAIHTIKEQRHLFPDTWSVILFTVSLRTGARGKGSKEISRAFTKELINIAGSNLISLDYDEPGKDGRVKLPGSGRTRSDGITFYAHEHKILLSSPNVKARFFTYIDKSPMLSLSIAHKNTN